MLCYIFAVAIKTGYYLSYKDIALISNSATGDVLDNKQAYDTLIRYGFAFKQIGDAVVAVRLFDCGRNTYLSSTANNVVLNEKKASRSNCGIILR